MLRRLFGGKKTDPRPGAIYAAIMAASRQKIFYSVLGVADTLEGRFELLIVHAVLVARRLGTGGAEAKSMSQTVFDLMFADLDQAMRESGVGDLAVPKRIKRMAEAYYGRAKAYDEALAQAAPRSALGAVIDRNIFGNDQASADKDQPHQGAMALQSYIRAADAALAGTDETVLLTGNLNFPVADEFAPRTQAGTKMGTSR